MQIHKKNQTSVIRSWESENPFNINPTNSNTFVNSMNPEALINPENIP